MIIRINKILLHFSIYSSANLLLSFNKHHLLLSNISSSSSNSRMKDLSWTMCSCSTFILNRRFEYATEQVETTSIMLVCFLLICVWCVWNMQSLNCRQPALCMSCNVDHRVGASGRRVDADNQHYACLRFENVFMLARDGVSIVEQRAGSSCR